MRNFGDEGAYQMIYIKRFHAPYTHGYCFLESAPSTFPRASVGERSVNGVGKGCLFKGS